MKIYSIHVDGPDGSCGVVAIMHEIRCNTSRRFATKAAGIPIENYTVKSLTPWAPSITPDSMDTWESLIRAFGGTVDLHVHGETRLGQIAVV